MSGLLLLDRLCPLKSSTNSKQEVLVFNSFNRNCRCLTIYVHTCYALLFGVSIIMLVLQAKGGGLAFLKGNSPSFQHQSIFGGKSPQALLAYINADHEYILFDPYDNDASELSLTRTKDHISADETGGLLYGLCCFISFHFLTN